MMYFSLRTSHLNVIRPSFLPPPSPSLSFLLRAFHHIPSPNVHVLVVLSTHTHARTSYRTGTRAPALLRRCGLPCDGFWENLYAG